MKLPSLLGQLSEKEDQCYSGCMESKLIEQKRKDRIKVDRELAPEEKVEAFINHNRMVNEIYAAGVRDREEASRKRGSALPRKKPPVWQKPGE